MCGENAEMHYDGAGTSESVLNAAEQQLLELPGISGVGLTKSEQGEDTIIVYVINVEALKRLPKEISGWKVVGELIGEVRAQ